MSSPSLTEAKRLTALQRYKILDTGPEQDYDDTVALVSAICDAPVALVSLVDVDRQWFKARTGTDLVQTALDTSVCALAIRQSDVFTIDDLSTDPRTADMSLVVRDPKIRFYAGAPLVMSDGMALGSLCAIDIKPRPGGLTPAQEKALTVLARHVVAQIELRAAVTERDLALLDLEGRRRAEQQDADDARESEARLWAISPDLLVTVDFSGRVLRVNPAWTTLLGYEAEELVGRQVDTLVASEDAALTRQSVADAANGPTGNIERRFRHKDGSYRWFSWVGAPADQAIYATGRHITAEKEAADQLRKAEDRLRQSQKMETVGQLTGGVAHDFNNLLTVIRGSVDLLRRPSITPERASRYIEAIAETSDRAAALTRQLLAFAGRAALKPEVFDAGENVRALLAMIETLCGPMVRIVVDLDETPRLILADRSQLDTALVNIAVNGRDAMDREGTLRISVRSVDGLPATGTHPARPGRFVGITITDQGRGIAPQQIEEIFQPFFTTKSAGQGTGLGLSQVFGFIKQSGGEISVDSEPGQGSSFTLYLPESTGELAAPIRTAVAAPLLGHGARVLVVEDNADVGAFVQSALDELGYEAALASDAEEAMAKLARRGADFGAVFSDVVMPGKGGVEMAQEIRSLYPNLPVILTSGFSKVMADPDGHGFELLQKPYSIEELSRTLSRAMSGAGDPPTDG